MSYQNLIKSEYYRFNGSGWDLHYFRTSADVIVETENKKIMTATERNSISDYLSTFNVADKLLRLDQQGKVMKSLLPDLSSTYLPLSGGTLTGILNTKNIIADGDVITPRLITTVIGGADEALYIQAQTIDFNDAVLNNVSDPVNPKDATNKQYVDALTALGTRPIDSVIVATTGNVTLSGLTKIDNIQLVEGARVLVWKQTNKADNGVYIAKSGSWEKVYDDSTHGAYVFVEQGSTHNDWYFYCKDNEGTWISHGRPDTVGATGALERSGNNIKVKSSGITNDMLAGSIEWTKLKSSTLDGLKSGWSDVPDLTASSSMKTILENVINSIRILRGTAKYNTNTTETILGAYNLAKKKAETHIGTSFPASGNTGDLFFKTLTV